jgi:hypothetical protein
MIPGLGLAEAGMEGCLCRDPRRSERASTGHEDAGAGNHAWLPEVEDASRLGKTVAIEGLLGVLQKGVIT